MKIEITTLSYIGLDKEVKKELVKQDDLRIEMLRDVKQLHVAWDILGFQFDYSCSETKYGCRVTKTVRHSEAQKETVFTYFNYI